MPSEFMTSREVTMMRRDFEQNLRSPEANDITLSYYTTGLARNDEPPFHIDSQPLLPDPVTTTYRAIQRIIKERDLKATKSQILEVGDCAFYFSVRSDLDVPVEGLPIAEGTLTFIDPAGVVWSPKIVDKTQALKFLGFHVGSAQYCQVVFCEIKK